MVKSVLAIFDKWTSKTVYKEVVIDKVGADKALNEEETIKNKKDSSEFSREELEILPPALLSKEKLLGTAGLQVKKKNT